MNDIEKQKNARAMHNIKLDGQNVPRCRDCNIEGWDLLQRPCTSTPHVVPASELDYANKNTKPIETVNPICDETFDAMDFVKKMREALKLYFPDLEKCDAESSNTSSKTASHLSSALTIIEKLCQYIQTNNFWHGIVCTENGKLDVEQVKKELHDFYFIMQQVPLVYDHVTGGAMSKVMYYAKDVNREHDDHVTVLVENETAELQEEITRLKEANRIGNDILSSANNDVEQLSKCVGEQQATIVNFKANIQADLEAQDLKITNLHKGLKCFGTHHETCDVNCEINGVCTCGYGKSLNIACKHEWGTDGQHSNEYCKKCFTQKNCVWVYDKQRDKWSTGCGHTYGGDLILTKPGGEKMQNCLDCGRPITEQD